MSLCQREEPIGLAADRRRHHHQLMALAVKPGNAPRDVADALGIADRGSTILLNDQCHGRARFRSSVRKASVALVPPKPNELDNAARIFILPRDVRHEVEIALRVPVEQIRRRRRDLVAQRQHREHRFDAARRAQQVTGHRLGR